MAQQWLRDHNSWSYAILPCPTVMYLVSMNSNYFDTMGLSLIVCSWAIVRSSDSSSFNTGAIINYRVAVHVCLPVHLLAVHMMYISYNSFKNVSLY